MLLAKELNRIQNKISIFDNGCWEWQGSLNHKGYGKVKIRRINGNSNLYVHRVLFCHFKKKSLDEIKGLFVCHKCDNPKCCNPEHLFLGTHEDNMRDMVKKKRAKGTNQKGSKNNNSKLNETEVLLIRYTRKEISSIVLADNYQVSRQTIDNIRTGKSWVHVK